MLQVHAFGLNLTSHHSAGKSTEAHFTGLHTHFNLLKRSELAESNNLSSVKKDVKHNNVPVFMGSGTIVNSRNMKGE